jgi:hypothetical protein
MPSLVIRLEAGLAYLLDHFNDMCSETSHYVCVCQK